MIDKNIYWNFEDEILNQKVLFKYNEVIGFFDVIDKESRRNGKDCYYLIKFLDFPPKWIAKKHLKTCQIGSIIYYKSIPKFESIFDPVEINTTEIERTIKSIKESIVTLERKIEKYNDKLIKKKLRDKIVKQRTNSLAERLFLGLMKCCIEQNIINEFDEEVSKRRFKWLDSKRYDFWFKINEKEFIVELHGSQHYEDSGFFKSGSNRSHLFEKSNDEFKRKLAYNNGFNPETYFEIDCRKSDIDYILNNIKVSLNDVIDFNLICDEDIIKNACVSNVKIALDMWNNGLSITEIKNKMNKKSSTIRKYLLEANRCGLLTNYNEDEVNSRKYKYMLNQNKRQIVMIDLKTKVFNVYDSQYEINKKYNIPITNIIACCKGDQKTVRNKYIFVFKEDFRDVEEIINERIKIKQRDESSKHYYFADNEKRCIVFRSVDEFLKAGFTRRPTLNAIKTESELDGYNWSRFKVKPSEFKLKPNQEFYDGEEIICDKKVLMFRERDKLKCVDIVKFNSILDKYKNRLLTNDDIHSLGKELSFIGVVTRSKEARTLKSINKSIKCLNDCGVEYPTIIYEKVENNGIKYLIKM